MSRTSKDHTKAGMNPEVLFPDRLAVCVGGQGVMILERRDDPVPDHRIRLRGGWESWWVGSPDVPERITLPTRWGSEKPGRIRLSRRFGCPPLDSATQVLLLFLEHVPGIRFISLNDQEIPGVSPETLSYQIPLDCSQPRNVLVLEVEPPLAHGQTEAESSDWGCISLVIQTRRDDQAPPEPI
jgi:hypothetical protein